MDWITGYFRMVSWRFLALAAGFAAFVVHEIAGVPGLIGAALIILACYTVFRNTGKQQEFTGHWCYKCGSPMLDDEECQLYCPRCDELGSI
jgi:hypothetical protein